MTADGWTAGSAADVQVGDRIRTGSGQEVFVSRIDTTFLGRSDLIAFVEDTPERWFKQPLPPDATISIQRG